MLQDGTRGRVRFNDWLSLPIRADLPQSSLLSFLVYGTAVQPLAAHVRRDAANGGLRLTAEEHEILMLGEETAVKYEQNPSRS